LTSNGIVHADLAYLRSYDVDAKRGWADEALPGWYAAWVQDPYLERFKPRQRPLDDITVTIDGARQSMQRWLIAYPNLGLVDVLLVVRDVALPRLPISADPGVVFATDRWSASRKDVSPEGSLQWHCDMVYSDLAGKRVATQAPRRTSFGLLAFIDAEVVDAPGVPGFSTGERLLAHPYHHLIAGGRGLPLEQLAPYLVLAGVVGRGRHLMKRTSSSIDDVTGKVLSEKESVDKCVRDTAKIQAEAIQLNREISGWGYFNDSEMKRVFDAVDATAGVPRRDRDSLAASLSGIDRLVASLQALSADQFQTRVAVFGVFFGLLSVLLASTGVLLIVSEDTEPDERVWVLWTAITIVMATVGLFLWAKRRLRR